jgi:proliferating cell nuclear antigen
MVLEFTLAQSSVLKRTIEAMKELCKEINFDCSDKGIEVQSMDSSHVALVSLILKEKAFQDYKCDRATTLGMNMDAVSKVMKMCNPTDVLKLKAETGADHATFQCENTAEDEVSEFDLKLMQIESEHMEIPEQQYQVVCQMPSAKFLKIVKDLKEFGETMQISASKDGIKFSVKGDIGDGSTMIRQRDSDKLEERVKIDVKEPVIATFALAYLVKFAKAAPLCGGVELGVGADMPISVKYDLDNAENGHMQFHLAPKVED